MVNDNGGFKQEGWVPVVEQLPRLGERVLCRNSHFQAVGHLDEDNDWHFEDGARIPDVTIWLPLPVPRAFIKPV